MLQACALGYNLDSEKVQCVDQLVKATAVDESTLAVFELASPIPEPFTVCPHEKLFAKCSVTVEYRTRVEQ